MIAMTKIEMIKYLKDYANLQYLMMQYPEQEIGILFDRLMQSKGRFDEDTREYYDRMRRVYMIYNMMKKYSYLEDFLLNRDNYINNDDLDEIIPESSYSTNMGNLSNKKLLQLIRNTFNHNNSEDIDRFKISVNGRKIEIELLNGPVKIKFDINQLLDVFNNMAKHRINNLNLSFDIPSDFDIKSENLMEELDKIKFIHYYFNTKLSYSLIKQFNRLDDTKGLSNDEIKKRSEEFNNLSTSINLPVKYDLTEEQKKKIASYIEHYKNQNPSFLEDDINNVMFYFLTKVVPIPLLKNLILDNQLIFCERFMEDVNETHNSIIKKAHSIIQGKNPFSPDDSFDQETFELLKQKKPIDNLRFFKDLLDGEMTAGIPIIIYIDSVVTHCCREETIWINDIEYNVEKIRNSFAHGRWYITTDNSIMLFDADPKNIHDYNLEFVGKIDVGFFEKWADTFVEQNSNKINTARGNFK